MEKIRSKIETTHPAIPKLADDLAKGSITRREFLRTTTLLGLSAGAAYGLAGVMTGNAPIAAVHAAEPAPVTGGVLRMAMQVQEMTDPATFQTGCMRMKVNKAPFRLTTWAHRPLGTMALSLAYKSGVPWNETGYSNPEFDRALDRAEALLDAEQRRAAMYQVESILQRDAVVVQPFFRSLLSATTVKVKNYQTHPALCHQFNRVWMAS